MRIPVLSLILLTPVAAQYYVASTVAGNGQLQPGSADGSPALTARLVSPRYATTAANGDLFISDSYFNQIYRVTPAGALTLVAGAGRQGFAGDGGPATAALLDSPGPLVTDAAGNLYIGDQANGRIRRVTPAGVISTLANVGSVLGLTFDAAGNLYFTPNGSHTVRVLAPDGVTRVLAGTGTAGFSGDGGPAASATLNQPTGLRFDSEGNLYIADSQNQRIRRVAANGTITTVAGNGTAGFTGDSGPATAAALATPSDVAIDATNSLYIADTANGRIRVVNRQGVIVTVAGGGLSYADGAALSAQLPGLLSLTFDRNGGLILTAPAARQVRRYAQQMLTTVAGQAPAPTLVTEAATALTLLDPVNVALDANRNLYIADTTDNRILRMNPAGSVSAFAGNGFFGLDGNNGPAAAAQVGAPRGMAFDGSGNLWLSSGAGATIRRVTAAGVISLIGGGRAGFAGDGGPVANALFLAPSSVALDAAGNIFVADAGNHRVRRIDGATNRVSTLAGTGASSFSGDGGPAELAEFNNPRYLAFDRAGSLYVSDTANHRVRRIARNGIVTTVAGNGSPGFSGDGGAATAASLGSPQGLAVDAAGHLVVLTVNRVRRVDGATGIISTIGGNGVAAFAGDGGLATNASFDGLTGVALDTDGAIYVADARNFRVRKLTPARIVPEGVANAATLRAGPVTPGEIVSIFGFELGPAAPLGLRLDAGGKVATELGGTRVVFDGVAAPMLYVSPGQVNVVTPYGLSGESTKVQVVYQGQATNTITLPVAAASPGLFAVTNQDGSVNTASSPAAAGSVLILYGTGEGQTNPAGVDGSVATAVFPKPLLEVTVMIGGRGASVLYAGAAPGFVAGVFQINVQIPAGVVGTAPLQVRVGQAVTPAGTSVTVR